jgi:hypothetical protein
MMMERRTETMNEWTKEEIKAFQAVFPETMASKVMDRIIQKLNMEWTNVIMTPNVSAESLRQAQGALLGLEELDREIRAILSVDLEKEDETLDETEEEEDDNEPDVRG